MHVASGVQWVKRRTSTRLRIFEILFFIRCFFHVINGMSYFSFFFFQHYLCDLGIPLPKMEVTFSMQRLSRIEAECKHYMSEIQRMHRQLQEQRENEVNSRNGQSFFFFFGTWIWCKCASRTHRLAENTIKREMAQITHLFVHIWFGCQSISLLI